MDVCCECCVLSGRGLCDGLITRPEESYWVWRVVVCDEETSKMKRLKPATGLWKYNQKSCNARKTNNKQTTTIIIICYFCKVFRIYNLGCSGGLSKVSLCDYSADTVSFNWHNNSLSFNWQYLITPVTHFSVSFNWQDTLYRSTESISLLHWHILLYHSTGRIFCIV